MSGFDIETVDSDLTSLTVRATSADSEEVLIVELEVEDDATEALKH